MYLFIRMYKQTQCVSERFFNIRSMFQTATLDATSWLNEYFQLAG